MDKKEFFFERCMTYFLTRKAFSVIINICEHILLLWHKAVKIWSWEEKKC